jgi:predicted RNA-binding protein
MCMAKLFDVYESAESDEAIVEDIARMIIDGDRVQVETLFGETLMFHGRVRQIDFLKSRVQLEKD